MKRRTTLLQRLFLVVVPPLLIVGGVLAAGELWLRARGEVAEPLWVVHEGDDGPGLEPSAHGPAPGSRYRTERIPLRRPEGVVRLACLGGSTTYGHPFDPPGAFSDWLEVRLRHLVPHRRFEIFNLGSNGFNCERVLDLARCLEVVELDVLVVYTGHNEFLAANLDPIRHPLGHAVRRALRETCLGRAWDRWRRPDDDAALAVLARRDLRVHDEPYLADDELQRGRRRFRRHLEELIESARRHGVQVVLCHPVSDLLDTPPQVSAFAADTPAPDRATVRRILDELEPGILAWLGVEDDPEAPAEEWLRRLDAAAALDPAVARVHWLRGRLLDGFGRRAEALDALLEARDRDTHPLRATASLHAILDEVAAPGAWIADPRALFRQRAEGGIPGQSGLFVDYCHPTLLGHQGIAEAILRTLAAEGAWDGTWDFADEPPAEALAREMGIDPGAQARQLARRALAAIATAYFQPGGDGALGAAEELLDLALVTDADCAEAHAAMGFVRCAQGRGEEALGHLERARITDPGALGPLVEAHRSNAAVREIFRSAGVDFREGRPIREGAGDRSD